MKKSFEVSQKIAMIKAKNVATTVSSNSYSTVLWDHVSVGSNSNVNLLDVQHGSPIPSAIFINHIEESEYVRTVEVNNAQDRVVFLQKLILKRWQSNLLEKQLKMIQFVS